MTAGRRNVVVIDYGTSNLLNVVRAFEHCNATVSVATTPELILQADCLVLPGVGAFADGMKGLSARELIQPLQDFIATGKPFLGICVGLQLLFDSGEEFGEHPGLGLIPGRVINVPAYSRDGQPHKIPHIGWNELVLPAERHDWANTILADLAIATPMYFVHSFMAAPAQHRHRLADCVYNGQRICAAVQADNIFGCQFHPEKSGPDGLSIIHRFLTL